MREGFSEITCGVCGGPHLTESHPPDSHVEQSEKSDFERLDSEIDQSPLLGKWLPYSIALERARQAEHFGLPADATDGEIAAACDRELVGQMKQNVDPSDFAALNKYTQSTKGPPLDARDRQAVANIILNPQLKIYKENDGKNVNLTEYLQNYYAPLGVEVNISFDTLSPEQKSATRRSFKLWKSDLSTEHLEQETIAIPSINLKKGNKVVSVPILGADRNIHAPARDPETRERIGSMVVLDINHEPHFGSGLAANIGFMVHELDHAVRNVLEHNDTVFEAEDRIVSEGTAEFAMHRFFGIQNRSNPHAGFGGASTLEFASGIQGEGERSDGFHKHLTSSYASGFVLMERIKSVLGEKKLFELGYDAENALGADELKRLRSKIVERMAPLKETAEQYVRNF